MAKERTPNIAGTGAGPAAERMAASILPLLENSPSIVNLKVAVLALGAKVEKLETELAALKTPAKHKR